MKIMVMKMGEGVGTPEKVSEELRILKEYLMQFASPGTDLEVFPTKGVKAVTCAKDVSFVVPSAVQVAIQGQKNGFDAIIMHAI